MKTVLSVLDKIAKTALPNGMEKEIIIIDDGSTDLSRQEIDSFSGSGHLKIISHQQNLGKRAPVMTEIRQATGEIILIQDADLENDPSNYPALLQPILDGRT